MRIGKRAATRRRFLAEAATGALGAPLVVRASALGADGTTPPSERIGLGFIGFGGRARSHVSLGHRDDTQTVAVAEVDDSRRQALEEGKTIGRYKDFREVLERRDVDAVIITTPDHWKPLHVTEAARAGKDIFCEKPISRTIREARAMVNAVRRYGRVFQTGTQQRSGREFLFAAEMIQSGRIGQVKTVTVSIGGPSHDCYLPAEPVPDGLDWDLWLGPAPWRPYNGRILPGCGRWSQFRDYAGGWINEWGAHNLDSVQWALGKDHTGPVEVVAPNGKDVPWLTWVYDDGVTVYNDGGRNLGRDAIRFEGTRGKLFVGRGSLRTEPADIMHQPTRPDEVHLYRSPGHHEDFLRAIRTRQRPAADIAWTARSMIMCHLGNLAHWLGRPLKWDPVGETFVGDAEANRWLQRPYREPWTLTT